jgi:hypothetical protein
MLSPYERMLLAYFCKQPDQVPIAIPPFPVQGVSELMESAGRANPNYPKWDRSTRIRKAIEFNVNFAKRFPEICVCTSTGSGGHGDKSVHLAPILGQHLGIPVVLKESSKGGYAYSQPLIQNLAEFDVRDLFVPKLQDEPAMHQALENVRLQLQIEAETYAGLEDHVAAGMKGWASTRCVEDLVDQGLLSYQQFLIGMRLWPDKVHAICEITTEYVINALKLIETVMGKITKLTIADHCTTFMSVTQAQEFWVPFVQRVNKAFNGALRIYHNEGHILHLVHLIPAAGFDAFQVGPETNLSEIRTIVGNNLALFGNIDPVYTFPSGSPQEVREACIQAIMRGGVDGGFLLSTGGGPPRSGAPVQNIEAMIAVVKEMGQYPISRQELQ